MLEKDLGDARNILHHVKVFLKSRIYFKKLRIFFPFFFLPLIELKHFFNNSCENQKFQLFELKIYFTA